MNHLMYNTETPNFFMSNNGMTYIHNWIPCVEEESVHGSHEINLQTKHFSSGKLFLTGEVNSEMANNFVSELLYLVDKGQAVDIYINSPGGSVNAGLVIYDVIQACKDKIEINMYCVGMAASMAAVILAGGPKGHRFILPNSQTLIHEVRTEGGIGGTVTSIKKMSESITNTNAITAGILAKHTGKTIKEIYKATSFDNVMNAEEAVAFGLCDEIKNIF